VDPAGWQFSSTAVLAALLPILRSAKVASNTFRSIIPSLAFTNRMRVNLHSSHSFCLM
jgi:hypothetical protein